jgi:hypothetical protein
MFIAATPWRSALTPVARLLAPAIWVTRAPVLAAQTTTNARSTRTTAPPTACAQTMQAHSPVLATLVSLDLALDAQTMTSAR